MTTFKVDRLTLIAVFSVCLALHALPAVANEVITVGQDGGTSFTTIQDAIDAANDGDEIIVSPGTYYENIYFSGKNIILRSIDPEDQAIVETTDIDGNSTGPVVMFSGNEGTTCVLTGFTITNGSGYEYKETMNKSSDPMWWVGVIIILINIALGAEFMGKIHKRELSTILSPKIPLMLKEMTTLKSIHGAHEYLS